jgi:diguanylate cyclase (GGDEF)-like protein/PAS domain S-box-containing protein
MPARERPTWLPSPFHLAAVSIVSALTAWAGIVMSRQTGNLAMIWFTNGILLAVLLTRATRQWPALLTAGLAGVAVTGLLMGQSLAAILALQASNIVAILLPAAVLCCRRPRGRSDAVSDLTLPGGLVELTLIGAVLGPALSGLLAAYLLSPIWHVPFQPLLTRWYLGDALGVAVVTPLALAALRGELAPLFAPSQLLRTLGMLGAYVLIIVATFGDGRVPLLFMPFPPLMLVVARLGLPGAGLLILPTAAIAFGITVAGHGPLMLITDISPERRLAFLQIYLGIVCATAYAIGIIVGERHRLHQALLGQNVQLSTSERLYRLLANNASDIITRTRLDGRRMYVSPSVQDVLGWSVEEMLRPDWKQHVHPDDFSTFEGIRERLRAGATHAGGIYRYRHKDGWWTWIEARAHAVQESDGTVTEFIGNLRDVTRQKEAELALEVAMAELAEQAATDELTRLPNRRRFDETLPREWRRAMRVGEPLSLLLIDVDHFKAFNDRYGHQGGDECLRFIADAIGAVIRRPHDLVARYGGEEFVAVLPATTLDGAAQIAETLRAMIATLAVPHAAAPSGVLSISIGVATTVPDSDGLPASLITAADGALYAAKRGGRNRVAVADRVAAIRPQDDRVIHMVTPALRAVG